MGIEIQKVVGNSLEILLVEDNLEYAQLLQEFLRGVVSPRLLLTHAKRLAEALAWLDRQTFDAVLLDLTLPDEQGLETFLRTQARAPMVPIVVLTGLNDESLAVKAVSQGAQDYLVKSSIDDEQLVRAIRYGIERKQIEEELRRANRALQTLSACHAAVSRAKAEGDLLEEICQVLIESGGYSLAWIGYAERDKPKAVRLEAHAGLDGDDVQALGIDAPVGVDRRWGGTEFAIWSGETVITRDSAGDDNYGLWNAELTRWGYASSIALPLMNNGQLLGALTIYSTQIDAFNPEEVRLLLELTDNLTYGIASLRTRGERTRAVEALRESEEKYRNLFENAPLCIFEVDLVWMPPTVVRANRQAENAYGWAFWECAPVPLVELFAPEETHKLERMIDAVRKGEAITLESMHRRQNGSVFPVRIIAADNPAATPSRTILTIEDISAEKVRRSETEAIAEERHRIAREIHDGLAQNLASLRLKARLWHDVVDEDPSQMHFEIDGLREVLRENIREVRRSIFALRPISLEELGFLPALEQFTREFGEQNQLYVDLSVEDLGDTLDPALELVLFRIIQEALNNVGKHARARSAWIDLSLNAEGSVSLHVRDDGVGFDTSSLYHVVRQGHVGLTQMRERVERIGGTVKIESHDGKGTLVRVNLPLNGA